MCWGEGGDTIRREHSYNASEPEHQVPCFRDPRAGRLLTPMGYSLPATTVGPPVLHPVPRCQELTAPPRPHLSGVFRLCTWGLTRRHREPSAQTGAPVAYPGESQAPAAVSHGDEHGTPRLCRPMEPPRLASLSAPGPHHFSFLALTASTPAFTLSLHAPGTLANASIQSGGHKRRLTRSCAAGDQESCFRGLFFFFSKGKSRYGDMESTRRWRYGLSEQVRGGSDHVHWVCSEHGSGDHTQCGMNAGTRG